MSREGNVYNVDHLIDWFTKRENALINCGSNGHWSRLWNRLQGRLHNPVRNAQEEETGNRDSAWMEASEHCALGSGL